MPRNENTNWQKDTEARAEAEHRACENFLFRGGQESILITDRPNSLGASTGSYIRQVRFVVCKKNGVEVTNVDKLSKKAMQ